MDKVMFNKEGYVNFTFGKYYEVLDVCNVKNMYLIVADDEGCRIWAPIHLFR